MYTLEKPILDAVVHTLRSYECGNASLELARDMRIKLLASVVEVPEGCTPDDARVLREANHHWAQAVHDLQEALEPFTRLNSSNELLTVQLRTEWITRARKLIGPKCDGNHGAPACADPECWQSEAPVHMSPQQVWPSTASPQHGQPVVDETPPWMQGMAHNIACEYTRENEEFKRERMERDIVNAMKEAAREVALYFAANPGHMPVDSGHGPCPKCGSKYRLVDLAGLICQKCGSVL